MPRSSTSPIENSILRFLEEFYQEVGLDPKGTTARKLKEIGEKLTRFQPYLEKLPNTWTTIYVLAKMEDHDFQRVVDSGVMHPFVTLKAIEDVVRGQKKPAVKSTPSTSSSISARLGTL